MTTLDITISKTPNEECLLRFSLIEVRVILKQVRSPLSSTFGNEEIFFGRMVVIPSGGSCRASAKEVWSCPGGLVLTFHLLFICIQQDWGGFGGGFVCSLSGHWFFTVIVSKRIPCSSRKQIYKTGILLCVGVHGYEEFNCAANKQWSVSIKQTVSIRNNWYSSHLE